MKNLIQAALQIPASIRKRINPPILGMTSRGEQEYYRVCARQAKAGSIVDLGCWMGSTTIPLAKGSRENPGGPLPIYAYDLFEWASWMDSFADQLHGRYLPGESFLPEARGRLRQYADCVQLIKADLSREEWTGGRISVLLVDAMKNAELTSRIARTFFPHLAPGGHLIHQDFKHFYTPWIHILQYRLKDLFRIDEDVADGATVSFQLLAPVSLARAEAAADFHLIPNDEVEKAFEYGLGLVGARGKPAVAAAHVMYYIHTNNLAQALRCHDDYAKRGLSGGYDWTAMQSSLTDLRRRTHPSL